jgi:hypothetical protein
MANFTEKNHPAVIEYADGKPIRAEWYKNDSRHREIGPAVLWMQDGFIHNRWYKNDVEITGELINPMRIPLDILDAFKILPQPIMEAFVEHYWHWGFSELGFSIMVYCGVFTTYNSAPPLSFLHSMAPFLPLFY